ncbi:MAG: ribosome maturation factor RimM [Pilosibacter sp.]
MEKYLRVGVITSPHGVRGEVKVYPTTDDVMRFKKLDKVILDLGRGETRELKIRQVKFFKNMVILKFDGVDTMNRGGRLASEGSSDYKRSGDPAEEDEFFITDLIGLNVVTDEGETLGTLTDVMETGANDVYCVKTPEGKELLLPAIRDCILDVDLDKEEMLVHVLPGLLDL